MIEAVTALMMGFALGQILLLAAQIAAALRAAG
jgi:hypothetical protein